MAGMRTAAADISFNKSAHSQTNKYILSPLAETLLCNEMRRRPTERGKYLFNRKIEILVMTWDDYRILNALLLPIDHSGTRPIEPVFLKAFAIITFENFEYTYEVTSRWCLIFLKAAGFILCQNQWRTTNCCYFWI